MKKTNYFSKNVLHRFLIIGTASGVFFNPTYAETMADFQSVPPLVDISAAAGKPNILMVLDNSNSMDEAETGAAVGSDSLSSKSEIARNALKTMITTYGSASRMGLMAYQQDSVSLRQLHDSQYDISFDSGNYKPDHNNGIASLDKKNRIAYTGAAGAYVYYNVSLPFYSFSNAGSLFCHTTDTSHFPDPDPSPDIWPTERRSTSEEYQCYENKNNALDDSTGFSPPRFTSYFSPTDSDIAQGIYDFGKFLSWNHVGPTWFSNNSPGKGMLHVEIAEVDAAQQNLLLDKLATSQFLSASDTPLRNAGLTPLEGTLQSASAYFQGTLNSSEHISSISSPIAKPPTDSCGVNDYVVLVTDGLPSTDASGTQTSDTATAVAAVAQAAADLYADAGVKTYVVGFALPPGVDGSVLDQVAAAGQTTAAYLASDSASLNAALNNIFNKITTGTLSSTGATVLANNASGDGAVFQALYNPEMKDHAGNKVTWTGSLSAIFIDSNGLLREDSNQNGKIDDYAQDKTIIYFYDAGAGRTRLKRYTGTGTTPPDTSSTTTDIIELEDLKYIWSAQDQLSALTNLSGQRNYEDVANASNGRHILTSINGSDTIPFTATQAASNGNLVSHLMLGGASAADMINYVRGQEISGYRSRSIDRNGDGTNEVYRLGDIVHSTPVAVRLPSNTYDTKNKDATYASFREHYSDRRQMVYVGGNDGMIHAFNAGFWNDKNKQYTTTISGSPAPTAHPLGAELWGYVPRSALPHLQWLKDTNYQHVYYVDGKPIAFDANIFTADADHPHGWGTVLAIGMRLGGGDFQVDTDNDGSTDETLHSSYILLDITNPETAPTLIAEISDTSMGYTTSVPALAKMRVPSTENQYSSLSTNDWQLIFGSGPTDLNDMISNQKPVLYHYNLSNNSLGSTTINGVNKAFVGDIAAIDWGSNYHDDILYFGLVGGTLANPDGRVMRLRFDTTASATTLTSLGISTFIDTGLPTFAKPLLGVDGLGKAWVHFGTGRLLVEADNATTTQQKYFGVFEKTDNSYAERQLSELFNSTDIRVFESGKVDDNGSTFELPSGTQISSFNALANAIPENKSGWFRNLAYPVSDPSGRNTTTSVQARTVVFFTEYTPGISSANTCQPEGSSRLYGLDYRTGTALPMVVFDTDSNTTSGTAELSNISLDIGRGMASAPALVQNNAAPGEVTIVTQNSEGEISTNQGKVGVAITGRQSWREISF